MNLDNNQNVMCPNCGAEFSLAHAKGPSCKTLDNFQSLVAVATPMLIGLGAVVTLRIVEHYLDFTPSIGLLLGVFIGTAAISFPFMVQVMVNYQKNMLEYFAGLRLYSIKCACHNEFFIIRATRNEQVELLTENTPNIPE